MQDTHVTKTKKVITQLSESTIMELFSFSYVTRLLEQCFFIPVMRGNVIIGSIGLSKSDISLFLRVDWQIYLLHKELNQLIF